ncbi:hypothetical protein ACWGI1_37485 [Streptomyces sp. NPDC054835]
MHIRTTAILTFAALALSGVTACAPSPSETAGAPTGSAGAAPSTAALPAERLQELLLAASDLDDGTTVRSGDTVSRPQDTSVLDCEPLQRLGDGSGDPFADLVSRAKAVIVGTSGRRTTEELYSAPPAELAQGIRRIMDAMAACPTYQLATATSVAQIDTRAVPAPHLGQEQWAQVVTASAGGRSSVTEQIIVRDGVLLLVVSGPPAEIRAHAEKAWAKATSH